MFGSTGIHQSPENTPTLAWGQTDNNETDRPANEASGGWGAGESETNNTGGGWGAGSSTGGVWGSSGGGGWGSSAKDTDSGGGVWGATTKDDKLTNTTQPPVEASSESAWGSGGGRGNNNGGVWGAKDSDSGGGRWGSTKDNNPADSTQPQIEASSEIIRSSGTGRGNNNTAGSSANDSNPGSGWGAIDNPTDATKPVADSSANARGTTDDTQWGSSGWGSSNNTWALSNETSQPQPANEAGPDKGKGKAWEANVQNSNWSGWRGTSNSETAADLPPSGGGWANPSVPATADATQGNGSEYAHPLSLEWYAHASFHVFLPIFR